MGQKLGAGGCALFSGASWVPIEHKVAWAEAYLHTKWHLSPSSHLATTDTGRKLGGCAPLEGELGPHLTQCRIGRGLPLYRLASMQPSGHNRCGPKIGGLRPFMGRGLGSRLTQSPNFIEIGKTFCGQMDVWTPICPQKVFPISMKFGVRTY